jgi:formylglycine-generating enzyme required for sulfatase activity
MNRGVPASVVLGVICAGCSDPRVVLGVNTTDATAGATGDARTDATADATADGSGGTAADATTDAGVLTCATSGAGRSDCGADAESCCTSLEVPGGTYYRTYTNSGAGPTAEADPATVSGFRLDKYLVTVGRFRSFVAAWNGGAGWVPPAGSGRHAHLNGGAGLVIGGAPGTYEPGWVASDDANVAPTDATLACVGSLAPNLAPGSMYGTWTPSAGSQENLPITCVNWYEAYAFCIFDGGFLPSEAELEYAAVGGSAQREYPWGTTDPGRSYQYAVYGCYYPSISGACTGVANIGPVGTAALGSGLWGQLDLAGNVWEWTLDWHASYVDPCVDCANLTAGSLRSTQGGNFNTGTSAFPPSRGQNNPADTGPYAYGVRCARSP